MVKRDLAFDFVEREIRKKTFGIISTIDQNGHSLSTGIVYGITPSNSEFTLYILPDRNYKKVKNIEVNNSISFVIPFSSSYFKIYSSIMHSIPRHRTNCTF